VEDEEITRRLKEAGEGLGIRVIDSVIVGGEEWWGEKGER